MLDREAPRPAAKVTRPASPTSLCNEGHLLQGRPKSGHWCSEAQANGEGLSSPHNEASAANGLGVMLLIVSCCLEVTTLDPKGYCRREKPWRLDRNDCKCIKSVNLKSEKSEFKSNPR